MITHPLTLAEAADLVGCAVNYHPPSDHFPYHTPEQGVITSVNSRWVFVRFDRDNHSKAVHPDHLEQSTRQPARSRGQTSQ